MSHKFFIETYKWSRESLRCLKHDHYQLSIRKYPVFLAASVPRTKNHLIWPDGPSSPELRPFPDVTSGTLTYLHSLFTLHFHHFGLIWMVISSGGDMQGGLRRTVRTIRQLVPFMIRMALSCICRGDTVLGGCEPLCNIAALLILHSLGWYIVWRKYSIIYLLHGFENILNKPPEYPYSAHRGLARSSLPLCRSLFISN